MALPPGISYREHEFQGSRVHMVTVDLERRLLDPVLAGEAFPFRQDVAHHAALRAHEMGALVVVDGGFNVTSYHGLGIADQPQHALVKNREIWTTGIGGGGYGVLIDEDGFARTQKNHVDVRIWPKFKGSSPEPVAVDRVNIGHSDRVCAFTDRGGLNQVPGFLVDWPNAWSPRVATPIVGRHYLRLVQTGAWVDDERGSHRPMSVQPYEPADPPTELLPNDVVLESRWKLPLDVGSEVTWRQTLGAPGTLSIVSGWPEMVHDGVNVVPLLNLDPEAPHGPDNWFVRRNPRSSLGVDADGHTAFIIVVEGRLPNEYRPKAERSRGLRLKAFGEWARRHGVWSIVNMDGGGSAFLQVGETMIAPGCYNESATLTGQRAGQFCPAVF